MTAFEFEIKRPSTITDLEFLYTAPEPAFDNLTDLAKDFFQVPIAMIALNIEGRQWLKSCIGLDVDSTAREIAYCDFPIRTDEVMIVVDASLDARFKDNPLVTVAPNIRFYAGAPISCDGLLIGTLCIIDSVPRPDFGDRDVLRLQKLAAAVSSVLLVSKDAAANQAIIKGREKTQKTIGLMEDISGVGRWSFDIGSGSVWWSDQVFHIHGLSPDDSAPSYPEILKAYSENDAEKLQAFVNRAITTGEGYELAAKIIRPDGEIRDVVAKATTLSDARGRVEVLFGVFQDVTEYQSVIERLEESEARYKLLADNANDLVLQCKIDGTVDYASPSALRITGYDADQLISSKWCELLHPSDAERVPNAIRSLAQGGAISAEHPLARISQSHG